MKRFVFAGALALAACSGPMPTDPAQTLYALAAAYSVAGTAEGSYINQPGTDPAVVKQMRALDNVAFNALTPLTGAAQKGASIDAVALAAAQMAVTQFSAYVTAHQKAN